MSDDQCYEVALRHVLLADLSVWLESRSQLLGAGGVSPEGAGGVSL